MKNKIGIITQREFLTHVKKKSFVVMTFLAPFLIIAAVAVIVFMMNANKNTTTKVAVVDKSGIFQNSLKSDDQVIYNFYSASEEESIKDTLNESENVNGLLVIPEHKDSTYQNIEKNTVLLTNTSFGLNKQQKIENSLESKIKELKMKQEGIDQASLDKTKSNVVFSIINTEDGSEEVSNSPVKMFISFFLLMIIYTFILVYGMRVMRSVMEEKSNRVIEIIISSVKPYDLMMGKILGTTLVAFFQFTIWIGLGLLFGSIFFAIFGPDASSVGMMQENLPENLDVAEIQEQIAPYIKEFQQLNLPLILGVFLFYFIGGYIFYSAVLASIGAAVDSETETQQFMPVILIPLMLGFYGSLMTFENPEGPVAEWLSMIPITSPIAMVARIPFGVPTWQLILSMVILIASVIIMVKISARIYRIGILMYGKKTNFKEIWKWIRLGY